ncbi:hypothetical protein B0H17DRAFT_1211814 [Mycena rosella]|uniref:Uncharacterized protein n=1 Tax=Mycena rosella TaxID=1033263 RepID=A0AAD7CUF4_MYCRO|nr:hypothetical protein B0H17DRAFT_1211814 [Mycena rosella]
MTHPSGSLAASSSSNAVTQNGTHLHCANGVGLWSLAQAPGRQGADVLMKNSTLNWTGDPAAAWYEDVWRAPIWTVTEVRVPVARVPAITKTRINSA